MACVYDVSVYATGHDAVVRLDSMVAASVLCIDGSILDEQRMPSFALPHGQSCHRREVTSRKQKCRRQS